MALKNLNYCGATKETLKIFIDNSFTIALLSGLVNMFMILGTVLITGIVGIISYFILNAYGNWKNIQFDTIGPYIIILG